MTNKEKFKVGLKYIFVPDFKYWVPTFYAFVIFTALVFVVGFSYNFGNGNLETRKGIIDVLHKSGHRSNSNIDLSYNFSLEGDSQIYGQEIHLGNSRLIKLFLFGKAKFPIKKLREIKKGDTIEFYVSNPPKIYPYLLVEQENNNKIWYKQQENSDSTVLASYGFIVNGKTLFSHTKRLFVQKEYEKWSTIIFLLFFMVLFPVFAYNFIGRIWNVKAYINMLELKAEIISKIPFLEELFHPIVLDDNLSLTQKIENLRELAPFDSNKYKLAVDLAKNYWADINRPDKAEDLYKVLLEAYPNDIYVWDGYYEMLERLNRKKDLYQLEEYLYNLDAYNAEMFARWYKSAGENKRHKYWKNKIIKETTK